MIIFMSCHIPIINLILPILKLNLFLNILKTISVKTVCIISSRFNNLYKPINNYKQHIVVLHFSVDDYFHPHNCKIKHTDLCFYYQK